MDRLRPEVSFQKIIQRRIDTQLKPSTTQPQDNVVSNQAQATIPSPVPFDEQGQLEQVNVLYSFLENRYQKKVGRWYAQSSYGRLYWRIVAFSIRCLRRWCGRPQTLITTRIWWKSWTKRPIGHDIKAGSTDGRASYASLEEAITEFSHIRGVAMALRLLDRIYSQDIYALQMVSWCT